MKAYIICFIISMLFAILASNALKKNNKKIGILFLILSLLTVCLIAAFRSTDVGADVKNYTMNLFRLYSQEGYNFIQVEQRTKIEPLFSLLMCISSVFRNIHVCLFFIELACALPIYLFAYKEKEKYSIPLVIFIFLTTMYARSFNLMRQFIAISIIVYSISFLTRKQYKKTLILYIIAILFHYSSIISILAYFVIYVVNMKGSKQNRSLWIFFILIFIATFSIGIDKILVFLPNKYTGYLNSDYAISTFSFFSLVKKLFWICLSAVVLYGSKKDENEHSNQLAFFVILLIDMLLYFLSMKVGTFGRLGNYFLYIGYFYMIPKINLVFKQRYFINMLIIIALSLFWYNMTVVNYQGDRTYPYVSEIFKILNE